MEIRHNTELLERAVGLIVSRAEIPIKQAEALAAEKAARAAARRRLATGIAIAVAAIGIGLGLKLGWRPWPEPPAVSIVRDPPPIPTVTVTAAPSDNAVAPDERRLAPTPNPTVAAASDTHAPVLNYVKFASQTAYMFGRQWNIAAGHQYATDTQPTWDVAWCYLNSDATGVTLRVDLANRRDPDATPVGPLASAETLQRLGLTDAQAVELATQCPWLDGKHFSPAEFVPLPNRVPAVAAPPAAPASSPPMPPLETPSASPANGPLFAINEGYDGVGNDLPSMPVPAADLNECQSACNDNFSCKAFTFNKIYNVCFLKEKVSIIVANPQAVTGYKREINSSSSAVEPIVSQIKTQYKSAVTGTPYRGLVTSGFDACLVVCERDGACEGANFDSAKSECILIRNVTGTVAGPTMSSGVRAGSNLSPDRPAATARPGGRS